MTPRYPVFWNTHGRPFRCRLIRKGDRYGLGWSQVHDEADPLLEFYDATRSEADGYGPFGQPAPDRFCVSVLLSRWHWVSDRESGVLRLSCIEEAWTLDRAVTTQVERWLQHEEQLTREPERFVMSCQNCGYQHFLSNDDTPSKSGWGEKCPACREDHLRIMMLAEIGPSELRP